MTRRDRVTEVLIRARRRITDKRRWMRFSRATAGPNGDRRVCLDGDPRAVRWCALGAVGAETSTARATRTGGWSIRMDRALYDAAVERLEAVADVAGTNDRRGHAAVLALFDQAIRAK